MYASLSRLMLSGLAVFFAASFTFFLIHFIPGDPLDFILGDQATPVDKLKLKQSLGLDKSLWEQYKDFIFNLLKGDLGTSLHSREPVTQELLQVIPVTFQLALSALFIAALWGIPAGVISVLKRGWVDASLSVFSLLGMSFPVFFLAPILIWIFAIQFSLVPVSEKGGGMEYFILPVLSLALPLGSVLLKMSRAALLEVMMKDYIRTAKAKGVPAFYRCFKHGLSNALIPIVTILGLQSGALLTGTVIVESIFDWPGVGLLLLDSIQRRDYPLVQGCVLMIAFIYVLVNLLTDLSYIILHPKMRTS